MEQTASERPQSFLRTLRTWVLLFLALFVADDLTFGILFWVITQYSIYVSAAAAFVLYWAIGYWVTLRGLRPNPGKWASKLLKWLQLEHENPELHKLEADLQNKITSVATAVPMTLLFGGIFTTLWLHRRNVVDTKQAKRLAFWLCGLYAFEPTAIHAVGIGGLILFLRHALF
jgi:hypothetical protein